jgi:hypothetical protein
LPSVAWMIHVPTKTSLEPMVYLPSLPLHLPEHLPVYSSI